MLFMKNYSKVQKKKREKGNSCAMVSVSGQLEQIQQVWNVYTLSLITEKQEDILLQMRKWQI